MAYLVQHPNSPYWSAQWTGKDGRKQRRSTKVLVKPNVQRNGIRESPAQAKARAQQIADAFEQAAAGERTLRQLRESVSALAHVDISVPIVEDFLNDFIKSRDRVATRSTYNNDSRAVRLFLDYLGNKAKGRIDTITKLDVVGFISSESTRVRESTVHKYVASLAVPFAQAYESELIARNPFAKLPLKKKKRRDSLPREAFAVDEVKKLIEVLPAEWSSMVQCCIYLGGLRLGDCALLKWSQVDFDNRIVTVVTGKQKDHMRIPLLPKLEAHLLQRREQSRAVYVHPSLARRYRVHPGSISSEFSMQMRLLGLAPAFEPQSGDRRNMTTKSFHSLRSTAATMLHMAGVDQAIAMKILSHQSSTVHQIYVRPSDEQIRAEMAKLEDV